MTGIQIVYWGLTDWETSRQRPQHLASALSHAYHVFYVRPVPISRLLHRRKRALPPLAERVTDRLTVIRPRVLSPGRLRAVARQNNRRVTAAVRTHLDPTQPIVLWLSHPDQTPQIGQYGERLVCFDSMDYHTAFKSGAAQAAMAAAELSLLRQSDLTFVSSTDLWRRASAVGARPVLVPNAVEFERFAAAATRPLPCPPDLATQRRPRLLFYGTLGPWVDSALLASVARARPDWTILLVGSVAGADLAPLTSLPNVQFLGWRPYERLPAYLQHSDICLLPFVLDDLTRAVDPVKLYEYLAAGKPVLASPLPELAKCGALVDVVTTPEAAIAAAERRLRAPDDEPTRLARLAFAAQHTWPDRAATVRHALQAALTAPATDAS